MYQTGAAKCTDLGASTSPCAHHDLRMIGALAISAFPLTSGFVSKSADQRGGGLQGSSWCGCCSPRRRPACSCTRASSSRGSCSSTAIRAAPDRSAVEHARRDAAVRGRLHRARLLPGAALPLLPFPVTTCRTPWPRGHAAAAAAVRGAGVLRDAVAYGADADRHLDFDWFYGCCWCGWRRSWRGPGTGCSRCCGSCGTTCVLCSGRASRPGSCRTGGWRRPGPPAAWALWVMVILVLLVVLAQRDTLS